MDYLLQCRLQTRCILCGNYRKSGGVRYLSLSDLHLAWSNINHYSSESGEFSGKKNDSQIIRWFNSPSTDPNNEIPQTNIGLFNALMSVDFRDCMIECHRHSFDESEISNALLGHIESNQMNSSFNFPIDSLKAERYGLFKERRKGIRGGIPVCWNQCFLSNFLLILIHIIKKSTECLESADSADTIVTGVVSNQNFNLGHMNYDPSAYSSLLQVKVNMIVNKFAGLVESDVTTKSFSRSDHDIFRNIHIIESPVMNFRNKCRFAVQQSKSNEGPLEFMVWEESGLPSWRVEYFPIADRLICEVLPLLKQELLQKSASVLRRSLKAVHCLSTMAGGLILRLMYDGHTFSDSDKADWLIAANIARSNMKSILSDRYDSDRSYPKCTELQLTARGKGLKLLCCVDVIEEVFHLDDGRCIRYLQSSEGFSNPNASVNNKCLNWLCNIVHNLSSCDGNDLLELYCGMGNHTMALAMFARGVVAVEINRELCVAAEKNLSLNGISNCRIIAGDSQDFARRILKRRSYLDKGSGREYHFGTVVVDPPRCGLDAITLELVSHYDNLIYISCNPDALLEDLKKITRTHVIQHFAVFDQFAYTPHLECGVVLKRVCENVC